MNAVCNIQPRLQGVQCARQQGPVAGANELYAMALDEWLYSTRAALQV